MYRNNWIIEFTLQDVEERELKAAFRAGPVKTSASSGRLEAIRLMSAGPAIAGQALCKHVVSHQH